MRLFGMSLHSRQRAVAEIDRAFVPARAGVEPLHAREPEPQIVEGRIEHLHVRVGIALARLPLREGLRRDRSERGRGARGREHFASRLIHLDVSPCVDRGLHGPRLGRSVARAMWPRHDRSPQFYARYFFKTWKTTLRITLGSASPARSATRTQRVPCGCRGARWHARRVDDKRERKMREGVRDHAERTMPFRFQRRGGERAGVVEVARPFAWSALRSCRRAIPSRRACAAGCIRRRAPRRTPRRAAARRSSSSPCAGNSPDRRARAPRTARSTGTARRPASSACRWWRRDPSWLARSRRRGAAA